MEKYLTIHLQDAIEINTSRAEKYKKLSKGKSSWVSRLLILSERILLPSSLLLDFIASFWQKRGIPVMKYEFIDMKLIANFSPCYPSNLSVEKKPLKDSAFIIQCKLTWSFFFKDHKLLHQEIENYLEEMSQSPRYYAMLRHVLESFARCLYLKDQHIKEAKIKNVLSPWLFCSYLSYSHTLLILGSSILDNLAYPTQKMNIPIIIQDVPHIETKIDIYNSLATNS